MKRLFLPLLVAIITISCSKEDAIKTIGESILSDTVATINGVPFIPDMAESFEGSESGINLQLSKNGTVVSIQTSGNTAGTYSVASSLKSAIANTVTITVVSGDKSFEASSGTVTITIDPDGKISGTYNFSAGEGDDKITVSNGYFSSVAVNTTPTKLQILTGKLWRMTDYSLSTPDGTFNFIGESCFAMHESCEGGVNGPVNCNTYCGTKIDIYNGLISFNKSNNSSLFTAKYIRMDYSEDSTNTVVLQEHINKNIATLNTFKFNSESSTLETGFGVLTEIFGNPSATDKGTYTIVTFSENMLVLSGTKPEGTIKVVLK